MSTQSDFKKLARTLKKLPQKLERSVVNSSVRAGAAVIRDEAKERVAKDEENVKKAIAIKKRRSKKTEVKYSVFIKKVVLSNGEVGKKNTKQVAYYLEYGTKDMRKRPFLRPTLSAVGDKPVAAARAKFKKELPRQLKKLKVR